MTKLKEFGAEKRPSEQNQLLFGWLCDDMARKELYEELAGERFPALRFKSLLRSRSGGNWSHEDVYLLSGKDQVETALRHYSVKPYGALDSGGKFMLGLDDDGAHAVQRGVAEGALAFTAEEISACALAAFQRAAVRPLKSHSFDLTVDMAEQAALHFVKLLFGFRDEAQAVLHLLTIGAYKRLVFQIIGRHFVAGSDSGLLPSESPVVKGLKRELAKEIEIAAHATGDEPFREGAPKESVIKKLRRYPGGLDSEMQDVIVAGLVAGTVGNIRAAVPIAIHDFFTYKDTEGRPLIDEAQEAARPGRSGLEGLIMKALLRNPPAAFLARTAKPISKDAPRLTFDDEEGSSRQIPEGAHLLLAMGADPKGEFVFGGDKRFKHNCVGAHLAWPLIVEVVRQVLRLPGLSQVIEPASGKPARLKKQWGVICEPYNVQYQRGRRLNQQPLHVVLKIKEPVKDNADKLMALTRAGAHIVEAALKESGIVHFAWFSLVENGTHLALTTVFDGDFDAYVEHFAVKVPLFDKQFEYLDVEQQTPIREHPKQFVENIRRYNRTPLVDYFYSAYPTVSVAEVINATESNQ